MSDINFIALTEVDANNLFAVTASRITVASSPVRYHNGYIYYDYGVNYFNGDFIHYFNVFDDGSTAYTYPACWCLANAIGDRQNLIDASESHLVVDVYSSSTNTPYFRILEYVGATGYSVSYAAAIDTVYYTELERDETVGTYGTLYWRIYTDAERTNLLVTLSLALHAKADFRYLYPAISYDADYGPSNYANGYLENLDIGVEGPTITDHGSGGNNASMINMLFADLNIGVPLQTQLSTSFDGIDAYVALPDNVRNADTAGAIRVRVKFNSDPDGMVLFSASKTADALNYVAIQIVDTGGTNHLEIESSRGSSNLRGVHGSTAIVADVWYEILATASGDAGEYELFINGVKETLTVTETANNGRWFDYVHNDTGTLVYTIAAIRKDATSGYCDALIGSVDLYNRVLTQAEVEHLYNSGAIINPSLSGHVGSWRMGNGDAYSTITDRSQLSNDGTMTNMLATDFVADVMDALDQGTIAWVPPTTNPAIYCNAGNVLDKDGSAAFSLCGWVKSKYNANISYWSGTLFRKESSWVGYTWALLSNTGKYELYLVSATWTNYIWMTSGATNMRDGNWHHCAMTYDGGKDASGVTFYLDGAVIAGSSTLANTLTGSISNGANLYLGGTALSGGANLPGPRAQFASIAKELSADEVAELYNSGRFFDMRRCSFAQDIEAYWPMGADGDSVSTFYDHVGSYNLTPVNFTGTPGDNEVARGRLTNDIPGMSFYNENIPEANLSSVWQLDWCANDQKGIAYAQVLNGADYQTGIQGYAIDLDGIDEYLDFDNVHDKERTDSFTISAWIKSDSTGAAQTILAKYNGTIGYMFDIDSSNKLSFRLANDWGAGNRLQVTENSSSGYTSWKHVAVTYAGTSAASGVKLYVNGSLVASSADYDALSSNITNSNRLNLGRYATGGYFDGLVDQTLFFDEELSSTEVAALYNNGTPPTFRR